MGSSAESYPGFGKISRWNREVVVTEKIDGTNGLISIERAVNPAPDGVLDSFDVDGIAYDIRAGSRNRWLSTEKGQDNHGFAAWVEANAETLIADLGEGRHYGEWYGPGIGKRFSALKDRPKKFMLFNTARWSGVNFETPNLETSTVLFEGQMKDLLEMSPCASGHNELDCQIYMLRAFGSIHVPGADSEGVVIYHKASNQLFKITLEGDETFKGPEGQL